MSESPPRSGDAPDDDPQPLTGEPAGPAPMRLRAEPPRVTRLSRKVLAGFTRFKRGTAPGRMRSCIPPRTAPQPMAWPGYRETMLACRGLVRRFPETSAGLSSAHRIAASQCRPLASPRPIPASARKSSGAYRRSRPRGRVAYSPDRKAGVRPLRRGRPRHSRPHRIWRALASRRRQQLPPHRIVRTPFSTRPPIDERCLPIASLLRRRRTSFRPAQSSRRHS